MKIAIATLGCKVNQVESAAMMDSLAQAGHRIVPFGPEAEAFVINTCTVTARADSQGRQWIRRAGKLNKRAPVIVTGCYAQADPEKLSRMPGVSLILGNGEKARLSALLPSTKLESPHLQVTDIQGMRDFFSPPLERLPGRTRAFLKIQDGCNARCSYCVVPSVRGQPRSMSEEEALGRIDALATAGHREIVLTGIHLGIYGIDLTPPSSLYRLLRGFAIQHREVRLRLSSLEPTEIDDPLLDMIRENAALCRHLHIPLQSGSDRILSLMGRPYSRSDFAALVRKIHHAVPGLAIGADVMAGFPGETDADFLDTVTLIDALPLAYLHVFPYSRRPGTPAALLPDAVPDIDKKRRSALLRDMGMKKRETFARQFVATVMDVLVEERHPGGETCGITDNYLRVRLGGALPSALPPVIPVRMLEERNGILAGEAIHG